jgi:hypothetical protein
VRHALKLNTARPSGGLFSWSVNGFRRAPHGATIGLFPQYRHHDAMPEISPKLAQQIARTIATEIGAQPAQAQAAIALLDEGATVPFIARYRKEVTGGLDDTQLRNLETRLVYLRELERGWKTSTCRTSPSAAPRRRSRARPGWSRSPTACWPIRRRIPKSPPRSSSTPRKAWPMPRPHSMAPAQS